MKAQDCILGNKWPCRGERAKKGQNPPKKRESEKTATATGAASVFLPHLRIAVLMHLLQQGSQCLSYVVTVEIVEDSWSICSPSTP